MLIFCRRYKRRHKYFLPIPSLVLQPMLLSASLTIMGEALANPERLTKSAFLLETDPNTGIYNIYAISTQYLQGSPSRCRARLLTVGPNPLSTG